MNITISKVKNYDTKLWMMQLNAIRSVSTYNKRRIV